MSWVGFFSSLPSIVKLPLVVFTILGIPALALYLGLVVSPAVVTAINQGRSTKIGPVEVGEYEEPTVKQCKLTLQDTKDSLHSLHLQINTLTDLQKSQEADLQKNISERNTFLRTSQEDHSKYYYTSKYVLESMNLVVEQMAQKVNNTQNVLLSNVNKSIELVNNIRNYCLALTK